MMLSRSLIALVALCLPSAYATTWYFLEYLTPSGAEFTGLSGTMKIPTLPSAGTYYLWPGLQPTDNSGVYQNVLDGRSGTWWIGSGWCCSNPSLPWGSGFNVNGGDTVEFSNIKGDSAWTSTLVKGSTGETVSNDFALSELIRNESICTLHGTNTATANKSFNQALFAIELDGVTWDFGPLEFDDVTIVSYCHFVGQKRNI